MRDGGGAVDAGGFLLGDEAAVWREHGVKIKAAEEGVEAEVEADEEANLDDFGVGEVGAEIVVEGGVDLVGVGGDEFAEAKDGAFAVVEVFAGGVVVDAFVEALLVKPIPLRRSGSYVASIGAVG